MALQQIAQSTNGKPHHGNQGETCAHKESRVRALHALLALRGARREKAVFLVLHLARDAINGGQRGDAFPSGDQINSALPRELCLCPHLLLKSKESGHVCVQPFQPLLLHWIVPGELHKPIKTLAGFNLTGVAELKQS